MLQCWLTSPFTQTVPIINIMPLIRPMTHRTGVVHVVQPEAAWNTPDSPWCNLQSELGSPTTVCITSGNQYGWLGFSKKVSGHYPGSESGIAALGRTSVLEHSGSNVFHYIQQLHCFGIFSSCWLHSEGVDKIILKISPSQVLGSRKKERNGNIQPAWELAECTRNNAISHLPDLPNSTSMDIVCSVPDNASAHPKHLQVLYADVRQW